MGITLKNKDNSINFGFVGYNSLKDTVASLYSKEFSKIYANWRAGRLSKEQAKKKLNPLYEKSDLTENDDLILDFLFTDEKDGKLSVKGCRRLYNHIKNYDDNLIYGYIGQQNATKFKDFKNLVQTCAKNRWILKWYE